MAEFSAAAACAVIAPFFDDLNSIKETFIVELFNKISPSALKILPNAFIAYILFQMFVVMFSPETFFDRLRRILQRGMALMAVSVTLAPASLKGGKAVPLIISWVIQPMESMSLAFGKVVVGGAAGAAAAAQSDYGRLACGVGSQIFKVLDVCRQIILDNSNFEGVLSGSLLVIILAAVMLMLPFAFVMCIFAAFLVEAMFKVVAVGIVSPLLMLFTPFDPLRPFTVAGARILLSAGLTIVFASGAMGFTMKTIDKHADKLIASVQEAVKGRNWMGRTSDQQKAMDEWYAAQCHLESFESEKCKQLWNKRWQLQEQQGVSGNQFAVFTDEYWMMFVIGFASILLHLQAKSLASNISGANDGAGPAAAVVGAAKMVAGYGLKTAWKLGFGAGGISSSASQALRGEFTAGIDPRANPLARAGQSVQQHGIIGGLLAGYGMLAGGSAPSGGGGAPGGARYSAGGGGGPLQLDPRTVQDLGKSIGDSVAKALKEGGGRDRYGA
jgi:hypothetical protein